MSVGIIIKIRSIWILKFACMLSKHRLEEKIPLAGIAGLSWFSMNVQMSNKFINKVLKKMLTQLENCIYLFRAKPK